MRRFLTSMALLVVSLNAASQPSSAIAGGVLLRSDSIWVTVVEVDPGITEIAPFDLFRIDYTIDQSTADVNSFDGAGSFPSLATAFSLSAKPLNALPWNPAGNAFNLQGSNYATNAQGDNFTFQMRGIDFPDGGEGLPFFDLDLNFAWPDGITDSGLDDQFGIQVGVGGLYRPDRAIMLPSYIRFRAGPNDYRTALIMPETPTLPGDYNANGKVDAADYAVWRDKSPGAGFLANDTTPGTINAADYDVWLNHFGLELEFGAGAASAVPEPGTATVVFVATAVVCVSGRSRRRQNKAG
jgi:hypothetical protein